MNYDDWKAHNPADDEPEPPECDMVDCRNPVEQHGEICAECSPTGERLSPPVNLRRHRYGD